MEPVAPDAAMTTEHPVHGLRHPDDEAAHTAIEPRRRVRFQQQVQMVPLNAPLQNAKTFGPSGPQCTDDGVERAR